MFTEEEQTGIIQLLMIFLPFPSLLPQNGHGFPDDF